MQSQIKAFDEYFIPYKKNQLYVKVFNPPDYNPSSLKSVLLLVHWMDVRGHMGNSIYDKIGLFFSEKGIPVFLFDTLGSGRSKGSFEFLISQKDQIITVYKHIQEKFSDGDYIIIPIVHSISAVAIMYAIDAGLPIKRLIWLGGPPSHSNSIKRDIKSKGRFTWVLYRTMGKIDSISGLIGFPITRKLFGFRLRISKMQKSFSKAHGARMMLPHTEMDILAVFGTKDKYLKLDDIDKEFPEEESKHITRIIMDGADHSFQDHIDELLEVIQSFINK